MADEMYIYSNETNEHVATVIGSWRNDREAVEAAENAGYSTNDYSNTCTLSGLSENRHAEIIELNA